MKTSAKKRTMRALGLAAILILGLFATAQAKVDGLYNGANPTFNLTAATGYIVGGDGAVLHIWGLSPQGGPVQYPAPTLIIPQGSTVTVNLTNQLAEPVSLVFPGQTNVQATGGIEGLVTREAVPGGTVTYTFTAATPGTFMYQSGSNMALQIEMGLAGAIIVRPAGFAIPGNMTAYGTADTAYDQEILYFQSEMDHRIHEKVDSGQASLVDLTTWFPYYWFYNGRNAPDVFSAAGVPWLPNQPYDCFPHLLPGQKMLLRIVGAGRDMHPFHHHGNSATLIAVDGQVLESTPGSNNPDLGEVLFTQPVLPGQTRDVIFSWNGNELGFDIYGHVATDPILEVEVFAAATLQDPLAETDTEVNVAAPSQGAFPKRRAFRAVLTSGLATDPAREVVVLRMDDPAQPNILTVVKRGQEGTTTPASWSANTSAVIGTYHGQIFAGPADNRFPVTLPDQKDLTMGAFYSGSPFLGAMGTLPPGEGGFNLNNGLAFMWHSHSEKELTNNNIFPGGAISIAIVEPFGTTIEQSAH